MKVKYIIQHRLDTNRYYAGSDKLASNVWCFNPTFATRFPNEALAILFMNTLASKIALSGIYRIREIETLW